MIGVVTLLVKVVPPVVVKTLVPTAVDVRKLVVVPAVIDIVVSPLFRGSSQAESNEFPMTFNRDDSIIRAWTALSERFSHFPPFSQR